jgi:hypothetical protein
VKAVLREVQASHEHEFEAAEGLPEPLPPGERVLWQGRPDWRALAVDAFHVRAIGAYLVILLVVHVGLRLSDGGGVGEVARSTGWLAALFGLAWGTLLLMAWLSAAGSAYTLTDRRLVMRVGIVLTLTFNLPLRRLSAAGLRLRRDGHTGDIPLQLMSPDRIAFFHLWPHARPWKIGTPEPMLRCIPDAARVAQALQEAWAVQSAAALPADRRRESAAAPAAH